MAGISRLAEIFQKGKRYGRNGKICLESQLQYTAAMGKVILRAVIRNIGKNHPVEFQNGDQLVLTQKRIKKQREIKFPRLESGAFNPYALITTNLGDGEVSEYEIDTDTDFIKVTLMY